MKRRNSDTKLQKTSLQTVSISQTSVKKTYQSYPSLSILIIIEYHWSIMTYKYHCFPHFSTFFHVFIRVHPFSLSGSSDLPILPPRPGMALGAMLSSVTFPGDRSDKWWQDGTKCDKYQYQTSIKYLKIYQSSSDSSDKKRLLHGSIGPMHQIRCLAVLNSAQRDLFAAVIWCDSPQPFVTELLFSWSHGMVLSIVQHVHVLCSWSFYTFRA